MLELNGEPDHAHVLVSLPPHVAISEYVNALKTNTARVLRRDFADVLAKAYSEPVLWRAAATAQSALGVPRWKS